MSYAIDGAFLTATDHFTRARLEVLRIAFAILCCVGIFMGEYRLLPQVIQTAVPAVLLTGIGRGLWSLVSHSSAGKAITARRADALLCLVGFIFTGSCLYYRQNDDETRARLQSAFEFRYTPVLTINLVSTALAMRLGKSILVPIDHGKNEEVNGDPCEITGDMIMLLTMTGITGLGSVVKLRRSYTSWPQYLFLTCFVVLWSGRDIITSHGPKWLPVYDADSNPVALQSIDSEDTCVSEVSEDMHDKHVAPPMHETRKSFLTRIILVVIVLPAIWLAFIVLNCSQKNHQVAKPVQPIFDLDFVPKTDVELVISMYKEPIEEVAHLISTLKDMPNMPNPRVHIYIKDIDANVGEIKESTGADQVTPLPNIGREGETYLKHILGNWDSLAKQTVFLQADVHNPREFYPRIRDYFVPGRTGMLSLGWSGQVCNCDNCGDRFNLWDTTHLFPEISNRINNATKCENVVLSYKGQFVASAKRIRGVDKSVYQDLHDAFVNPDSWAHQEEYLQGRPDSMNAPAFGYLMERIWNLLFQCNSMDVAWKCPTLLSGLRIGGNFEDCQCLDPAS